MPGPPRRMTTDREARLQQQLAADPATAVRRMDEQLCAAEPAVALRVPDQGVAVAPQVVGQRRVVGDQRQAGLLVERRLAVGRGHRSGQFADVLDLVTAQHGFRVVASGYGENR